VGDQCIDCDLCRETAPDNFTRIDDGGYSYVFKQPITPQQEALCKEAMEGCPVAAIGNNGEGEVVIEPNDNELPGHTTAANGRTRSTRASQRFGTLPAFEVE